MKEELDEIRMRIAYSALIAVHALIHGMGFSKACIRGFFVNSYTFGLDTLVWSVSVVEPLIFRQVVSKPGRTAQHK